MSSVSVTVATSCNLSDGVVLGVDSAVTIGGGGGSIAKVYENAEKLFGLGDRPIGVAAYGLGNLGARSIGSYLNEFQTVDPGGVVTGQTTVGEVVEALRDFFLTAYRNEVVPALEQETGLPFVDIPPESVPVLGLVVGGFSHGEFLSEVWETIIPSHATPNSATLKRDKGSFGTNWFAMLGPIGRYVKGYDPALADELIAYLINARGGTPLTPQEEADITALVAKHEYPIPFQAMPILEGIEHTRFLVELVVNHHRYAVGAPVVGGRVNIGVVTYKGGRFQILSAKA